MNSVKPLTLDVLRRYHESISVGDVPDYSLALYSYLCMDGYVTPRQAVSQIAKSLSPPAVPGEGGDKGEPHSDDLAVDRFAAAMKAKLAEKRAQGYHGWDDPEDCTIEHLINLLVKHVGKGDPVDVGNFAMMIHQRGGRIE